MCVTLFLFSYSPIFLLPFFGPLPQAPRTLTQPNKKWEETGQSNIVLECVFFLQIFFQSVIPMFCNNLPVFIMDIYLSNNSSVKHTKNTTIQIKAPGFALET